LRDPGFPVEHLPWSQEGEAGALLRGDIGIAPTPCDRWTLGKCGFKIVQYMAAGLPAVASPVGANAEIVREGETGFLADTPQQWADAIERLARDVELRRRMGATARAVAEREYSLTRAADTWAQLLAH
jgi:glycosyltransferase involved in cell wall biosynthesis